MLVDSGHQVTGMTRRPDRAEALRAMGAQAEVADAYDADAVRAALARAAVEAGARRLVVQNRRRGSSSRLPDRRPR
jgi:uncharacterized protein YbjT (DUF2867 family)